MSSARTVKMNRFRETETRIEFDVNSSNNMQNAPGRVCVCEFECNERCNLSRPDTTGLPTQHIQN